MGDFVIAIVLLMFLTNIFFKLLRKLFEYVKEKEQKQEQENFMRTIVKMQTGKELSKEDLENIRRMTRG